MGQFSSPMWPFFDSRDATIRLSSERIKLVSSISPARSIQEQSIRSTTRSRSDRHMKKSNSIEKIENCLGSLTKEELISLILKLASQPFFDAINAQFASQSQAKAIFRKVAKAVNTILSDERLLYDPSKFTEELLEQLEKLRGLWDKLPSEIGGLLLKTDSGLLIKLLRMATCILKNMTQRDEYFESQVC